MGTPRREQTLIAKLKEMVSEPKARYILYKVGLGNQDWDYISNAYLNNISLEDAETKYKTEEDVQNAMKYTMKILHHNKLIELYNIYFDRAKEDTQAFKAFIEFSESFFAGEKESDLIRILNGVDLDE